MQTIYLDYNATTPIDPSVLESMKPALSQFFGNPSSAHLPGLEARKLVEKARNQVALLINCRPEEIVFTSGGTESNNHAIKGIAYGSQGGHIITSNIEHPATLDVCRFLQKQGYEVSFVRVDSGGVVDPGEIESAIRKDTLLITVMHANNEIGTIQPIEEIGRLARRHNIPFHTDAAQSAGKIPVDVQELGVDLLSLAGHKLYGPKGIGALYIRSGLAIEKLIHGADHERNRRAGTENVPEITGLGKACEMARLDLESNRQHMQQTRDALFEALRQSLPGVAWNGDPENCLPNTLSMSFPGADAQLILSGLEGVAASAGAACHAENEDISHVLDAIGLDPDRALGTIRFSTGKYTTLKEISAAARLIIDTAEPLMSSRESSSGIDLATESSTVKLTRFTHGLGCACKLRPQDLEEVLRKMPLADHPSILVDSRNADDAAVWKINDQTAWVQSVDFFTPIVDDPFTFGAIAAANALSDLYAMGAQPLFGLNIVAFPARRLPLAVLDEILRGALSVSEKAGIHLLGGHTIEDHELKFGMVVNGQCHPEKFLPNSGARPGDALILTKPIGTGILSTALKKGVLQDVHYRKLVDVMTGLNDVLVGIPAGFKLNACTDITGFGLLGHLLEMVRSSRVSAELIAEKVPLIHGVLEYLSSGTVPGGTLQNQAYTEPFVRWKQGMAENMKSILNDAQTSGGLLISSPEDKATELLKYLLERGAGKAAIIGRILPVSDFLIKID